MIIIVRDNNYRTPGYYKTFILYSLPKLVRDNNYRTPGYYKAFILYSLP